MADLNLARASVALLSCVFGCASPSINARAPDQLATGERIGRLESERAAAVELAKKEHAARVEAEVKVALLSYSLAIREYNVVLVDMLWAKSLGKEPDAESEAKFHAAVAHMESFVVGCGKDEPGDNCVERKAREAAR